MPRAIVVLLLLSLLAVPVAGTAVEPPRNLLVIVTTADPVTQLMAMVLATQALQLEADVDVLLCGQAGSLAISNAPEQFLKPNNTSPQMLVKKLLASGVTVEICPPYLPNSGQTAADLLDGVTVAKPPEVAARLLREDTRILSY